MASVILAIIVAPLTLAFITGLRVVGKTEQKFTDSRSGLISAADFASDVGNANAVTTTNSPSACGSGGTLLATFLWNDPNVFPVVTGGSYPNKVSYFYDSSSNEDAATDLQERRGCEHLDCRRLAGVATHGPVLQLGRSGHPGRVQRRKRSLGEDGGHRGAQPADARHAGTRALHVHAPRHPEGQVMRAVAARRRGDSEAGATLIVALVMIMIISVAIVAVLAYASTSLHTIAVIKTQRQVLYAADGSVQTAIQAARTDATVGTQTAGSGCGSLATLDYLSVGGQPASSVACTVVVARGPGVPGVDMPPYALWAVGPNGGETGIDVGKSGGLSVAGSVASNMPGTSINATDLDITGYTAEARANCTGTIIVADPADKMCNTGSSYPDPNYPSRALPALSSPNPAPTCTANNGVLQFSPGYYTNAAMLSSPTYSQGGRTCTSGYVYLKPGVYYFDFGFDPLFPGNVWDVNGTVIGGEPKGNFNPDAANRLPQSIANGSNGFSVNCKTELDGATSGVQLVFGGASQMTAESNSTQVELCADPTRRARASRSPCTA